MSWKILFGVTLAIALQFCHCDEHTFGTFNPNDKILYEKELFNQVADEGFARSKNYTLIFKYINSEDSKDITYAVFNVQNAVSIGNQEQFKENFFVKITKIHQKSYGNVENNVEPDSKKKTLQAMLSIVNGTNVVVTAKIYGSSVVVYGVNGLGDSIMSKVPKTMTVVYGHNSTRTRDHKIVLGHRQPNDQQLDFQQKVVQYKYRFAEAEFKYPTHEESKPFEWITAVEFSFDVRYGTIHSNQWQTIQLDLLAVYVCVFFSCRPRRLSHFSTVRSSPNIKWMPSSMI